MQAILITAYKNYFHLQDIIDFFDSSYSIYIHIDKKSTLNNDEIIKLRKSKNVKYITQLYDVNWGGINHLLAILKLAEEAIKDSKNEYFHLITGHDYPVKNLKSFNEFFIKNKDLIFMEYHPFPYEAWENGGFDRVIRYNTYDLINGKKRNKESINRTILKIQTWLNIKRTISADFPQLFGGSTYWSMNKKALNLVFNYVHAHPSYLKRFKYSFCSEEIFFQTILLNSELKENVINNNKRFIVWENRNGNYPANLDINDLHDIEKTDALFARKFEFPVSKSLLEELKSRFIIL